MTPSKVMNAKQSLASALLGWIIWRLWKCTKFCWRTITGQCELERIQRNYPNSADETLRTEESLTNSRFATLREAAKEAKFEYHVSEKHAKAVVLLKLKASARSISELSRFETRLAGSIHRIVEYNALLVEVERLRTTVYNEDDAQHRSTLIGLWKSLIDEPYDESKRISRTWQRIGFQGNNPATDFRGMGYLGLLQLSFLAEHFRDNALQLVANGDNPRNGYCFAVTGINLTSCLLEIARTGRLKWRFFTTEGDPRERNLSDSVALFHRAYCWLYVEFDKAWTTANPDTMMQFESVLKTFMSSVKEDPKSIRFL